MSEDAASLPRQEADSVATMSRQAYTLTVEDVAVTLADHNVYRDPRTIQRWCKSGRLDCILDQENGERYLITEKSLQKIVATLTADQVRASRRSSDVSGHMPRHDTAHRDGDVTMSRQDDDSAATDRDMSEGVKQDQEPVQQETEPDSGAAASLKQRISELETELAMTKADKQVREQVVDYLKEQFTELMDGTFERAEQIGQLREENKQLRNLLLSPSAAAGNGGTATDMYNNGNETHRQFDDEQQFPPAAPLHDDLSSGADGAWPEH